MTFSPNQQFVAPRPLAPPPHVGKDATAAGWENIARAAAWPLALILVIHRVAITAFNGDTTDDFTTVYSAVRRFLDGQPVYEQAYNHVDPLYLYNPGATLLLTPLGISSNLEFMRYLFIVANAAAIIVALAVLTRLMGHHLNGALFPAAIACAFATESVTNTLAFSNINGLLLLALSVFLWGFTTGVGNLEPSSHTVNSAHSVSPLRGRTWRLWAAGIAIGLAIVIKPQFAPLLFLPLVRLEWRSILVGLGIPVALNAVAWPIIPGASEYLSKLVPYLGITRDYANSSLPGVQAYFDLPGALYFPVWALWGVITAVGIIVLLRWRTTDVVLWACTTAGLLLVGVFTLSSLGQQYYSMWLFPLILTVVLPRSVFHSWPAWLAAGAFLMPITWYSSVWPDFGRWASVYVGTMGWMLLIVIITATALGWWAAERTPRAGATPRVGARVD